ncbi:hypothetical protein ACNF49_14135 [Actinomadura sp. ATCC 39365]
MATSRVPDVLDALVALFGSAPALDRVKVFDGPPVTGSPVTDAVFVGYDGDPDGDGGQAVEFTQEWASIGQRARDETFTVTCAVLAWRGSTAVRPVRERAFALLAAAEDALRADPSLGLPPPTVVAVAAGSLQQAQWHDGVACRIPFQVAVKTRI